MKSWITRTVLILSLVSLLNDMAGELLYPVIPLYMASIGYGALWIGILEGLAEATSGLTKGWFGEWSDRKGMRLPFVQFGYLLSAICKPFLALFSNAGWAVLMRTGDRLGKGIRTGARDAMLADESHDSKRGKVYGFHRALDTTGAVIGPLLALVWLSFHRGGDYKALFYYALIPGLIAVLLLFFIKEKQKTAKEGLPSSPFSNFGYWKKSTTEYRKLLSGILIFTLFNSSDMFLLLLVKKIFANGIYINLFSGNHFISSDMLVVILYIFYNLFYATISYPAGYLSDKTGPKGMLIFGYCCFFLAYGGMAYSAMNNVSNIFLVLTLFAVYGIYSACTDGVSKAWVSRICTKEEKGIALGLFSGFSSIATLLASVIAGVIWTMAGPVSVFIIPAIAALVTAIYLTFVVHSPTSAIKQN
jgi:MFS family permease